jgi:hypothetical protein
VGGGVLFGKQLMFRCCCRLGGREAGHLVDGMTKQDKLKLCVGCRDDFYNGKHHLGAKECWHLSDAEVVRRTLVGTWQPPPYKWMPAKTLQCHSPDGSVWIDANDPRIER